MTRLDAYQLLAVLRAGRCPDCDGMQFRLGPRGGASQNIECRGCLARFNVAGTPETGVVFAERIPREAEGGSAWPHIE